jgi:putative nucleotidyltransferase with HDIG domain
MVWGTVMIGYRPNSIVAVFDYILIVLICGLIISIPWQQYGLYITGSLVCLFVLTPLRSFKVETHYIMEVSLVIFGICAVYLSYISYQKTCENFELQEKLEQQSENLEAVVRAKTDELKLQKGALSEEIIQVLTSILGYYDTNSKDHSQHVAELSEAIAREMGFDLAFQKTLYYTGLIHDVGKIRIEKDILNKQGYLNNVEYDLLRQHPRYGYEMTKTIPALKEISKFIFHHHERYDGKGYPLGFKEEAIPKASQILAVADAWDAMRSPRNYREMMSREDAIREMKQNSGKQFSPDVIEAFLNLESRLK